eukprot:CAMPEP_0170560092 /NCGR_PEP_ID=MMETSP0211-20121228/47012_1 /TAXON_ID=311385 /ORGANISM="Pseudokeronopsis sp., Strain OXSARD2" /LENGTH=86 /DNA_ID=CAMNT_0010873899 /DNA_START=175 /DNA_END=435 /DNA_ORIENTATION=+
MVELALGDHSGELGAEVLAGEEEDVASVANLGEVPLTYPRLLPEVLQLHYLQTLPRTRVLKSVTLKDRKLDAINPREELFLGRAIQ